MKIAAKLARIGSRILDGLSILMIVLLLVYAIDSLYETYRLQREGISYDLKKYKPDEDDPYSLQELMQMNPDVVGWITIDETYIDQPITQGKDDMEYLNKNALKKFSLAGSIFLSAQNQSDFSDPYNLTYGHHMEGNGMYSDVTRFVKDDYFQSHREGLLYDEESSWTIHLFALLETEDDDPYVFDVDPSIRNADRITYLQAKSTHYRKIDLQESDQIIALSTCKDATSDHRIVLFGKMEERKHDEKET